jgi:hypothetical protein
MAQLPPGTSHEELRWRVIVECRPDVIENMPCIESPETSLLGERGEEYL